MNKIVYTLIATTLFIQTRNNYAAEVNQPAQNNVYTRSLIVRAENGDSLELSPADLAVLRSEYLKQLALPEEQGLPVEAITVLPVSSLRPLQLLLPGSNLAEAIYSDDISQAVTLADYLVIPNGVDHFLKRLGRENIKLLCQLYQDPHLEGQELVQDYISPYIPYKPTRQFGEVDNRNPDAGHTSLFDVTALSPDGNTIISGSDDRTIIVWHRGEDGLLHMTQRLGGVDNAVDHPHIGRINLFDVTALSPDGNTIISGSNDRTLIAWHRGEDGLFYMAQRLGEVDNTVDHPHIGHTDLISSIALSADGNTITSGSYDHTLIVWRRGEDGLFHMTQRLGVVRNTDHAVGHTAEVLSVVLSPDGNTIISSSIDLTIIIWQRSADGRFHIIQRLGVLDVTDQEDTAAVNSVALSTDSNTIISGSDDRTLIVWRRGEDGLFHMAQRLGEVGNEDHPDVGHTGEITSVALSLDDNTIVSGSFDRTLIIWHRGEDGQFSRFNPQRDRLGVVNNGNPNVGHIDFVKSVALSPDGNTIISSSYDRTLIVWRKQSVAEFCVAQAQASEAGI